MAIKIIFLLIALIFNMTKQGQYRWGDFHDYDSSAELCGDLRWTYMPGLKLCVRTFMNENSIDYDTAKDYCDDLESILLTIDDNAVKKMSVIWLQRNLMRAQKSGKFDIMLGTHLRSDGLLMTADGGKRLPPFELQIDRSERPCKPYCNLILKAVDDFSDFTGEVVPLPKNEKVKGYACEKEEKFHPLVSSSIRLSPLFAAVTEFVLLILIITDDHLMLSV